METGWNALAPREARDVTTSACRVLGIDKAVFADYQEGLTLSKDERRLTGASAQEHADHDNLHAAQV
jgi:hypothetical protein